MGHGLLIGILCLTKYDYMISLRYVLGKELMSWLRLL